MSDLVYERLYVNGRYERRAMTVENFIRYSNKGWYLKESIYDIIIFIDDRMYIMDRDTYIEHSFTVTA